MPGDRSLDPCAVGLMGHPAGWPLAATILATPTLLFPHPVYTPLGLCLVVVGWGAGWVRTRRLVPGSPLDWPIRGLLAVALVSLWPSVNLSLSLAKLLGLLAGVLLYYGLLNWLASTAEGSGELSTGSRRRLDWSIVGTLVAAAAAAAFGLLNTEWFETKFFDWPQVYESLPRVAGWIQSTSNGVIGAVRYDELGGAVAMILPLSLAAARHWFQSMPASEPDRQDGRQTGVRVGLVLLTLALTSILVLAQSRTAYLAAGAGIAFLVWYGLAGRLRRGPHRRVGVPALLVAMVLGGGALMLVANGDIERPSWYQGQGDLTLAGREEVWRHSLYMLADAPFTGVGLNTFPLVFNRFYPGPISQRQVNVAPHAYNLFLQTALDLGILGLGCLVGLLVGLGRQILAPVRLDRWLMAGLWGGLVSYLVFGLTDANELGTRASVFFWVLAALVVSATGRPADRQSSAPGENSQGRIWRLAWIGGAAVVVVLGLSWRSDLAQAARNNLGAIHHGKAELERELTPEQQSWHLALAAYYLGVTGPTPERGASRRLPSLLVSTGQPEEYLPLLRRVDGAPELLLGLSAASLRSGQRELAERTSRLAQELE